MRAFAFCLLALVVAASARDLRQVTELNCEAMSSASLDLRGSGSGSAQSTAFCQALADAEKVVESEVGEYIRKFDGEESKGQCTEAEASRSVTGVAEAIASAYTSVTTKVEITGTGTACASGFAQGDALAVSIVSVYLDIAVRLIEEKYPSQPYGGDVKKAVGDKYPPQEKVGSASGQIDGSGIAAAIATAWAGATSEACTTGGFKSDFQEAFVKSTTVAVAELWATIVVELCSNFDDADKEGLKEWAEESAKSFSEIGGEISVDGNVEVQKTEGGEGSGVADEIPPCEAAKNVCCSDTNKAQDTCSCGTGCTVSKSTGGAAGQIVWLDDASGESCFC